MLKLTIGILILLASSAGATKRFVDGACTSSGTGTSTTCGASGPFVTIGEGVAASACGDTLEVTGAHGGFNGQYFTEVALADGTGLSGMHSFNCSSGTRFVIEGCPTGAGCVTTNMPIVRGMQRVAWTDQGGGVFSYVMDTMPHAPSTDGALRRGSPGNGLRDPYIVMQDPETGAVYTILGYQDDSVHAPVDGKWSYDPATQTIYVNPIGTRDPAQVIWVPHFGYGFYVDSPSQYVTINRFVIEGDRTVGIQVHANGGLLINGMVITNNVIRYTVRHGIRTSNGTPALVDTDNLLEYNGYNWSWAAASGGGWFCQRIFLSDGVTLQRNICRHNGSTGTNQINNVAGGDPTPPYGNPDQCPWCQAPRNDTTATRWSSIANCIDIKQTVGGEVSDNLCDDEVFDGIQIDTSRQIVIERNTITNHRVGMGQLDFTGECAHNTLCVITGQTCALSAACQDPLCHCYSSDNIFRSNILDNVGTQDINTGAMTFTDGRDRATGAVFGVQAYNNVATHVGSAGIIVKRRNSNDPTPIDSFTIVHNTINGQRTIVSPIVNAYGLIVDGPTNNSTFEDNIVDGVANPAFATSSNIGATTFDYNGIGASATGPNARWGFTEIFTGTITTGVTGNLSAFNAATGFEANGFTGAMNFAGDLYHLLTGSAAIDVGINAGITVDIDAGARPAGAGYDPGADEFNSVSATTTTTIATTTSTTVTTTTLATGQVKLIGVILQGPKAQ